MVQAFSRIYGSDPVELTLTDRDTQAVAQLKRRYESQDWLYGKPIPFSCTREDHFPWGYLQLQLFIQDSRIHTLRVYTDATDHTLSDTVSQALSQVPFSVEEMSRAVSHLNIAEDLAQLFHKAL